MTATRQLLCIEITTPTAVWSRALVSTYIPTAEELTFYYTHLCGLQSVTVTIRVEDIPETFNESLLSVGDKAPCRFPSHDLETKPDDTTKRKQYNDFLTQLVLMERNRASLQVFAYTDNQQSVEQSDIGVEGPRKGALLRTRGWVTELLRKLNSENNYEESTELTIIENDTNVPLGWVVTPVVSAVRESNGSRIVTNNAIGKQWERLLGTDVYPDLVMSRRISTVNWAFQHPTSEALVKATLDWYLASQDVTMVDGVSNWIPRADAEMNILFNTFKRIKVNERFIMEGMPNGGDKISQVFNLLSAVESKCLGSSLTDDTVSPISTETFQRYMTYLFRGFGVNKDLYSGVEAVNQIFLRWGRSNLGFRADADPLLDSWKSMWHIVMRGNPTAERVRIFLMTLDCWDPMESASIAQPQRVEIANEWMNMYIDNEFVPDVKSMIRSTFLHDRAKEWCHKYVPEAMFVTNFGPTKVGPAFSRRGYNSVKRNNGRFTFGLRWKDPSKGEAIPNVEAAVAAMNEVRTTNAVSITTSESQDGTEKKRSVVQTVTAEDNSNRIEHFFVATETIHLGNL